MTRNWIWVVMFGIIDYCTVLSSVKNRKLVFQTSNDNLYLIFMHLCCNLHARFGVVKPVISGMLPNLLHLFATNVHLMN